MRDLVPWPTRLDNLTRQFGPGEGHAFIEAAVVALPTHAAMMDRSRVASRAHVRFGVNLSEARRLVGLPAPAGAPESRQRSEGPPLLRLVPQPTDRDRA